MKFAAFIVTYERETILLDTIEKIFFQTQAPEKILIVDNSLNYSTKHNVLALNNPKISYHRVGFNSGPAGGVAIGLKVLADEGFDWIYWGDDDDPPTKNDVFEKLLKIALTEAKCGVVGCAGHFFNAKNGMIERVPDAMISDKGVLDVDHIGGNQTRILNGEMIRNFDVLPDKDLFFGFEDLDVDLNVKKNGYRLLVDKESYLKLRLNYNRLNLPQKMKLIPQISSYWREYYSIRSLLFIYKKNKLHRALFTLFFIKSLKLIYNFKFGSKLGFYNVKITFLAFFHFIIKKKGLTVKPVKKINK